MDKKRRASINEILLYLVGSQELVNKWWDTPNKNWEGLTPEAAYILNPSEVTSYILKHYQT